MSLATAGLTHLLEGIDDEQKYGERLVSVTENRESKALSDYQQRLFLAEPSRLSFLGLTLRPQLDGSVRLRASNIVGIARFVAGKESLSVEVLPKIANAAFLRMLQ